MSINFPLMNKDGYNYCRSITDCDTVIGTEQEIIDEYIKSVDDDPV